MSKSNGLFPGRNEFENGTTVHFTADFANPSWRAIA